MGEEDDATATVAVAGNPQPVLCEECGVNPFKYKCPGCSLRSCSLPCVNSHKRRTSCTGKRKQTQFVPLSQFDDNLLLSDYNLLEEVKRFADSSKRKRTELCGYSGFKLPFYLVHLQKAAASRRTKLLFLPKGMSKRERNQTRLDRRTKSISWTIEWRFHSTDAVLHDNGVHEDTSLCSVISSHLQPSPWNHELRQFCDEQLDRLKFVVRNNARGPKSSFRQLDINAPLRKQLANLVILEYPVIDVFLPLHQCGFEIVRAPSPFPEKRACNDTASIDNSTMKGICFKEEEIEDDGSLEPQVQDLMNHVKSSPQKQPKAIKVSPVKLSNGLLLEREKTGSQLESSSVRESESEFAREFDYDQGLMDAYSDIIAHLNPDEFLDFDGGHAGKGGAFLLDDELEEGEIQE